jgi:2-succinyl-6-hydroxy-2,4-cyclohexadiene-1-carboxylate synthase
VDGPAAGHPLVLLHGFTGDSTTWEVLLPHLGDGRPVLGVDLVGHGRSAAPDDPAAYTMPATVRAVAAALGRAGVGAAHWLGYSMGGRVALQLALARPDVVRSLVLVGASPGLDDPAARRARVAAHEALAAAIERDGVPAFVDRWMAHPLFATQAGLGAEHLARARAQRLRNRPHALAHTLRGMGTGAMEPVVERLAEIEAPVLLAAGALDEKFRALAERMAARLRRAEVVVVPGAGHAVQVEAPAALGAAVRGFLEGVESR